MSSFTSQNEFPRFSQVDHAAEAAAAAAEADDRAFCQRVHARQDEIVERFCELLADQCYRFDGNALGDMHALLSGPQGAPVRDLYDARQYANVGQPGDHALATLVRWCYAQANLAVAEQVRNALGDVAF